MTNGRTLWSPRPIADLLSEQFAGEWGQTPCAGQGNASVLRATDLDTTGHLNYESASGRQISEAVLQRKRLQDGDLILEAAGGGPGKPVGHVGLFSSSVSRTYVASNFFRTLRPKPNVDSRFLWWRLSLLAEEPAIWQYQQQTTGIINLRVSDYLRHPLNVPEKPEQTAIAAILDTVDEAIRQTSAVIEKLKKIKAGLLHDLLMRGIDEAGQLRDPIRHPEQFQDTPLGKVPKEWKVKPLGTLCDLLNGLAFKPTDWTTIGRPIIRIQNLNGGLDFNYYKLPVPEKYVIPPGTLLFSWSGNRGTSFGPFIWPGPTGLLNQHIFRVYPAEDVRMRWFYYALDDVRQRVERAAHGAIGLVHVRRSDFVKYLVGRPEPDEQERIEVAMQHHDARARAEEDTLRKLTLMKQGLMQDLLTGRVRVPMKTKGKAAKP